LILLSFKPLTPGVGSLRRSCSTSWRNSLEARYVRVAQLKATDINWTFFSPAFSIAPGTRTDKFRIGTTTLLTDDKGKSRVSAEDYADALVTELETPAHERAQMTIAY
jgi:putative NADH-flavin reductase